MGIDEDNKKSTVFDHIFGEVAKEQNVIDRA